MSEFNLQAIIDGDSLQLSEVFATIAATHGSAPASLRQQLASDFLAAYSQASPWDDRLANLFNSVKPVALAQLARSDEFYCDPQHPLRQFLHSINAPANTWCPRDSKPNQQLFDKLSDLFAFAARYGSDSPATSTAGELQQQLDEFNQWLTAEDKRAAMLESRLCETELANLKLESAEARVVDVINRNLAHCPLPSELHNSISGTLKSELQYWAFNTAPDDLLQLPLWKTWQRLLPALGQLFASETNAVDEQLLYEQIPRVLAELERSLQYPNSNAHAYGQLVEQLNHCLMCAIQKQAQECPPFPALNSPNSQNEAPTHIPKTLLQQTEHIKLGDWILFSSNSTGSDIRCKLAFKHLELDQLLFVDHTGRKVMNKSTKDFALCLSTGIARPLPAPQISELIRNCITPLIERANRSVQAQLLAQKNKAEQVVRALIAQQQAADAAAERARAAEQARMEQQLEARRAAARKAMLEARALADEKMRRAAEQAAEAERLRLEQAATDAAEAIAKQQQATQNVSALQVGAWLEINSAINTSDTLRAKLSVIINSTGKYIFADQVGRKVAEYTREQLITALANEQIKIVRNGDNFEDQLAKVIRGLRRDIS